MSTAVASQLECGWYMTDDKRLVRILSMTETEALCENVMIPDVTFTFRVARLLNQDETAGSIKWRRVHPEKKS